MSTCSRASSELLSLVLVTLLSLPVGLAASQTAASAPEFDTIALTIPFASVAAIEVNSTGDGDNVDSNAGCDADAATPGEQCTLRAAIQRANALAGDDQITFNIPTTQPNCDAATGKCTINLTKALPNLSTNLLIDSDDAELLTVRRDTGGNYRIFTIAGSASVTLSSMTIENGDAETSGGGGVLNGGSGVVAIRSSVVTGNRADFGAGIHNDINGSVTVIDSVVQGNSATGPGGAGIFNRGSGRVDITNSLIVDNSTGSGGGDGGGIYNNGSGIVSVAGSTIVNNFSGSSDGGGIYNHASGTVNVADSMIGHNANFGEGGGIHNNGVGTVNVTNSSISANFAQGVPGTGGGIRNAGAGALNVSNCTVFQNAANESSGGISGSATVKNTIIAGSRDFSTFQQITDVEGSFTSAGFNFIGDKGASSGFNHPTDQTGTSAAPLDPELIIIPISPTSGLTNGILVPRCGSPVVDKATSTPLSGPPLTTDLRGPGFPRTVDDPAVSNAAGGDGTDIGAFEQPVCAELTLTVNTTADADDNNPGDAACDSDATTGAQCTLRAAISEANALTGPHTIVFAIPNTDPGFNPSSGAFTINLTRLLPNITTDLTINGPGPNLLTVRRNTGGPYRIFTFPNVSLVDAAISGLKLSNGFSLNGAGELVAGRGGGILFDNQGSLTITDCLISDNFADVAGGGIAGLNGTVNVANSTFTNNFVSGAGGGAVFVQQPSVANTPDVTFNITNSTFIGNGTGGGAGGAILSFSSGTQQLNITNSTITGNTANDGSGIRVAGGFVEVKSSIIALNRDSSSNIRDVSGAFTSQGFNLIGNPGTSTGFTNGVNNDQVGTSGVPLDPKLDPAGLQNNGGPTQTIALLADSPAIDKGTATGLTGTLTTDQRGAGFLRTFDDPAISNAADGTDVGAFEHNPAAPTPTPTPTPTPPPSPSPSPSPTATPTPSPTPDAPTFQFDADSYAIEEGVTSVNVRVLRTGPSTAPAAVDITSEDGTAKQKGDYTFVVGHLVFAAGEIEKTFQVLINDDSYAEGFEFATLILQHPENGTLGALSTAMLQITDNATELSTNPIDDARTFVGTHYHDFLYRQGDTAGVNFWTQQLEACGGDASCLAARSADVSTAFFLSIEFQQTGYFVIRAHKAAFGNLNSNPRYQVFLSDQRQIGEGVVVGEPGFQQKLDANRQKYLEDFVTRAEFVVQFPQGQSASDYVDRLFQNASAAPSPTERDAAIAAYGVGDTSGRAAALRSIVESDSVFNAQYNSAFVLMQFYGYLRRNPDDAPDNNFDGCDFWLQKLNSFTLPGEDARDEQVAHSRVRRAEMVKAFIESAEYRQRFFGAPGGNQLGPIVASGGP